jgi:hypothetical protein
MYREIVSPNLRMLDEDLNDIEAIHQQLRVIKRLVGKLQMSSKAGQRWQQEMQDSIDDVLHDTSTEWLIEQGNDLLSQREPF